MSSQCNLYFYYISLYELSSLFQIPYGYAAYILSL